MKLLSLGVLGTTLLSASLASAGSVPVASCPSGFRQIGDRLCVNSLKNAARIFQVAQLTCQNRGARVATYGDLFYVYATSSFDHLYDPNGKWIGPEPITDDRALCGNRSITSELDPDSGNFDGICNVRTDSREFWCATDLQR
jgi:hypothetical protein